MREFFEPIIAIPSIMRDWWQEMQKPSYWWLMLRLFLIALPLALVIHFILHWA